jgi:hypothetical protein
MKKFLLINILIAVLIILCSWACTPEEPEDPDIKTSCKSTADCIRSQYCDLLNPEEDLTTGTLSYFCKARPLCLKESDCPMKWRCLIDEGFCITDKEAEGVLCKSDADCMTHPNTKCNLATGQCYNPDGGNSGNSGNSGDSGDTGDTGNSGDTGNTGDTGNSGDTGNTGNTGTSGDTGNTGNSGTILVSEDFEDGGTNWTIAGVWQIGAPSSGPNEAYAGSNVAATNLAGNYSDSANDILMLNTQISIPSTTAKPVIEFMAWVNIEGGGYSPFDYVEVLVKRDTDTWPGISGIYLSATTPSPLDALDNTRTKITKKLGTSYYKFTGDLSSYKGKTVQIGFRFKSDSSDTLEGIYIDNVVVK